MRAAQLTPEDERYLTLLENQRDEHMTPPLLSSFRVLALFACVDLDGQPQHVIGANCECANIGGALCAERSAICQLQLRRVQRVTTVYIVSDADQCLTPGTLCREFLSSSAYFTPQTPFIMRASKCRPCVTTLQELYPFPSIYDRVKRHDVLTSAQAFCDAALKTAGPVTTDVAAKSSTLFVALQLHSMKPQERAVYLAALEATANDTRDDLFPVRYAAAALFSDGEIYVTWQHKTLEYGSSLDPVSKLITHVDSKRIGKRYFSLGDQSSDMRVQQSPKAEPVVVVQVDQFGILHAPFARARAFFFEYAYSDLLVLVNDASGVLRRVPMTDLVAESPDCIAEKTANAS